MASWLVDWLNGCFAAWLVQVTPIRAVWSLRGERRKTRLLDATFAFSSVTGADLIVQHKVVLCAEWSWCFSDVLHSFEKGMTLLTTIIFNFTPHFHSCQNAKASREWWSLSYACALTTATTTFNDSLFYISRAKLTSRTTLFPVLRDYRCLCVTYRLTDWGCQPAFFTLQLSSISGSVPLAIDYSCLTVTNTEPPQAWYCIVHVIMRTVYGIPGLMMVWLLSLAQDWLMDKTHDMLMLWHKHTVRADGEEKKTACIQNL